MPIYVSFGRDHQSSPIPSHHATYHFGEVSIISIRSKTLPTEMPGKSIRHLRSASKESTASALRGRTRNLTSTSSLMHLTGNPYLDAERERDNERALLDRSLTYTAAASGKQAASGDEATDVGQASSTRTRDSGKRRAQVSGDQLESPRPSRATSKISNATTSKKMGKGKRKGKMKKVEKVLPMLGPTDDDTEYVISEWEVFEPS